MAKLKVIALSTLCPLIFLLSSCKKPEIYLETKEVLIIDAMCKVTYDESRRDEISYVVVLSENRSYYLEGKAWYDRYFDRIGDIVTAKFKCKDYGEDFIFKEIVSLEG